MPEIRTAPRTPHSRPSPAPLRLVEPLAALSRMSDLARGRPDEEAMRACLLATALGREVGLAGTALADVFWTALLRFVGCTATSHEYAATFGGDDVAVRRTGDLVDAGARDGIAWLLGLSAGRPAIARLATLAATLPRARATIAEGARADCEVGALLAARMGFGAGVQTGLQQIFERWDGLGVPAGLRGEAIAVPARTAAVAYVAVIADQAGGAAAAADFVRGWAGRALDPSIAEAFSRRAAELLAAATPVDPWDAVVGAEPGTPRTTDDDRLDEVLAAFGDAADLKSPVLTGHSGAVARLAAGAATAAAFDAAATRDLRRAALVHDLGRAGIATGTWEKVGPLSRAEWEAVRLHAYQTERILDRAPALAPLARVAGLHHERTDGTGYHRGARAPALDLPVRLLAAADAYQAMTSDRPHRRALAAKAAAGELAAMAVGPDAAAAVLAAAGAPRSTRRAAWPAGLTEREVEVLRLLADGRSVKEISAALVVSPATAHTHVVHIYEKAGVTTRAGATMFAMQHGLVTAAG